MGMEGEAGSHDLGPVKGMLTRSVPLKNHCKIEWKLHQDLKK
jgi:hypothetical protein